MSYRASPVFDEQGQVAFWVGIDADITEIKAIEAALRLSNHELEAFSYSVSHDLRSPLNTVDGFSRLLAKQLGTDAGDKVTHYLARIQAGVAQMGQLIEDLLSLAQVSRAPLSSKVVDLSALARSIADECQARDPERKSVVKIEKGLKAHGDDRLLRVVMENLLGNAWKFSSHEAVTEITVGHTLDAAGQPEFFVRDNGAGFDMAYVDKLFNPFQRLHAASEFPGTGIGLATSSRVIKRHGGRLWAEAEPGRGATFFFTLPKTPNAS
jgi:light-regulated signal transduction histidine kinase (bacteriophytochrome)